MLVIINRLRVELPLIQKLGAEEWLLGTVAFPVLDRSLKIHQQSETQYDLPVCG